MRCTLSWSGCSSYFLVYWKNLLYHQDIPCTIWFILHTLIVWLFLMLSSFLTARVWYIGVCCDWTLGSRWTWKAKRWWSQFVGLAPIASVILGSLVWILFTTIYIPLTCFLYVYDILLICLLPYSVCDAFEILYLMRIVFTWIQMVFLVIYTSFLCEVNALN